MNMYACQLCHEVCASFEAAEIFPLPETELDPMNLCLCPNCATMYRNKFRSDEQLMMRFKTTILNKSEQSIKDKDYVELSIDNDDELWFTQTHFAEIQALMKLADEAKKAPRGVSVAPVNESEGEASGLSVFSAYKGRTIQRTGNNGFEGTITDISSGYLIVQITKGANVGQEKQVQLSFVLNNPDKYHIFEDSND